MPYRMLGFLVEREKSVAFCRTMFQPVENVAVSDLQNRLREQRKRHDGSALKVVSQSVSM